MECDQNKLDDKNDKECRLAEAELLAEILSRMDAKQKDDQNTLPHVPGKRGSCRTVDLGELFYYFLSKLYLILLGMVLGALLMGSYAVYRITPVYIATSKLYIVGTMGNGVVAKDYKEVFKTWEVHQMVNEELGTNYNYSALQDMITVANPEDTRIMYIMVRHPDPREAANIANAYASAAKHFIVQTMNANEPSTFSIALVPSVASDTGITDYIIRGGLLGTVLTCGLLVLVFLLDNRPKSPKDIMRYANIPTLAIIPAIPRSARNKKDRKEGWTDANKLNITRFPALNFACTEAMNTLCTNLSFCGADVRAVLFTSRYEKEGKSSIAIKVMRTLAGYGKRVLLVDADLRCSTLTRRYCFTFPQRENIGLAQYLAGMCTLEDAIYQTDLPGAYILPAGCKVFDPMQLLASSRYREMMAILREQFDMVLLDSPSVGVIMDAVEIAKYCDGAIIVVGYNKGRGQDIGDVAANIAKTGCKVLGAVINRVKLKSFRNRKYYYRSKRYSAYYHHYGEFDEKADKKARTGRSAKRK